MIKETLQLKHVIVEYDAEKQQFVFVSSKAERLKILCDIIFSPISLFYMAIISSAISLLTMADPWMAIHLSISGLVICPIFLYIKLCIKYHDPISAQNIRSLSRNGSRLTITSRKGAIFLTTIHEFDETTDLGKLDEFFRHEVLLDSSPEEQKEKMKELRLKQVLLLPIISVLVILLLLVISMWAGDLPFLAYLIYALAIALNVILAIEFCGSSHNKEA